MYAGNQEVLITFMSMNRILEQIIEVLEVEGLSVIQTFDLQSAVDSQDGCECSNKSCPCQMKVLLVYGNEGPAFTLLLDSDGTRTTISLASSPSAPASLEWVSRLPALLENRI